MLQDLMDTGRIGAVLSADWVVKRDRSGRGKEFCLGVLAVYVSEVL